MPERAESLTKVWTFRDMFLHTLLLSSLSIEFSPGVQPGISINRIHSPISSSISHFGMGMDYITAP